MPIPVPSGDPASLRHLAQQVRAYADLMCGTEEQVRQQLGGIVYEGVAGNRFREAIAQAQHRVHAGASDLGAVARTLEQRAADIEQAIIAGGIR